MTAACGGTNITLEAGRDAKVCTNNSVCTEDSKETEEPEPTAEPFPTEIEPAEPAPSVSPSGDDEEGEGIPVSVQLSSGHLPEGLKDSPDSCSMGMCTWWNREDIVMGNDTFDTGFYVKCQLLCRDSERGIFEVKLAGKYSSLDATFGISADSTSDDKTETLKVTMTNQGTGKILYSKTLEYGKSYPIKGFDISGVGLLQITFEGPLGGTRGAVGAPVIHK
ncbi:hypothetical protein [Streptomyces xinghaiensis]|uniref:hypothetical protein n=1 Tax=Streptomyces xinghaiensis TaxID=1038928 RepID=UPI002E15D7A4|nr:hypothetical protein OG463_15080 [Streptomyces xinghaiensis]